MDEHVVPDNFPIDWMPADDKEWDDLQETAASAFINAARRMPCAECGGEGGKIELLPVKPKRVSGEMAIDAGDPTMEGMTIGPVEAEEYEDCPACEGTGHVSPVALAKALQDGQLAQIAEALEKAKVAVSNEYDDDDWLLAYHAIRAALALLPTWGVEAKP